MKIELVEGGKMPERKSAGAAGYDVYAREVELHKIPVLIDPFCKTVDDDGQLWSATTGGHIYGATIKLGFKVDCSNPWIGEDGNGGEYPCNWAALLLPRSGWGTDYGFRLKNSVGVVDPDYRGEVIMKATFDECPPELLEFAESSSCNGCKHDTCEQCDYHSLGAPGKPRPGQLLFVPCYVGELQQVDKLDDTERGAGGFGSTGHK